MWSRGKFLFRGIRNLEGQNATNARQIADMYESQGLDVGGTSNMVGEDEDEDFL